MKFRVESSSILEHDSYSGVGNYTDLLIKNLSKSASVELFTGPFFHTQNKKARPGRATTFLNKLYRVLAARRVPLPPVDVLFSKVDVTIFPNFFILPTKHTKHTMSVIHDLSYIHLPDTVEEKNLRNLQRVVPKAIEYSDYIITVSETLKRSITRQFNLSQERILVTPIPPRDIFFKKSSVDIHKKYGLSTRKYILFLGNLEPRKNIPLLVNAYTKLPRKLKEEYTLIIGGAPGWRHRELQAQIDAQKAVHENIVQFGYIEQADLPAFYQQASLFVLPSIYEGFGMPILEAMASGCKILVSDIPVFREVGGSAIHYADHKSSATFSRAIERVIESPNIDKVVYSNQLKKFSWKNNLKLIEKAISERP